MRALRFIVFAVGAAGLGLTLLAALLRLPRAGSYHGAYGEVLNTVEVDERRATDVVSAVNFDYRGLDTLGEEFILFTSVLAVAAVLRRQKGERESAPQEESGMRARVPKSDATTLMALALVPLTVCFGLYVVTHGTVSPGGGFQGGVVLATAPLVVFLCASLRDFRRIAPEWLARVAEGLGALGYIGVGLLGVLAGKTFLENVLPLGAAGKLWSGGTIYVLNVTVGLEVAAGFVELMSVFLEEAMEREP